VVLAGGRVQVSGRRSTGRRDLDPDLGDAGREHPAGGRAEGAMQRGIDVGQPRADMLGADRPQPAGSVERDDAPIAIQDDDPRRGGRHV
jgi:hypothetical protein